MQTIFARQACLAHRWEGNVRLGLSDGRIQKIETGIQATPDDVRVDTLLPALANLHSHSFQRAMAGLSEYRASGRDSFWTWRSLMYTFLDHITPDQMEAIAAQVFLEMQEAGYASVGEFHYLHHGTGGSQYDRPAELSERIFAASQLTGIGLTHLPVLYTYGGAGRQPLADAQKRFGNSIDAFADLLADCRSNVDGNMPADTRVGVAPHSLRAISPNDLARVVTLAENAPIHIHIAEQPKEVAEIQQWLGNRPVAWLLDNAPVDDRWSLIHATHMTATETRKLARSGAVAGLCPITEANLGDGPFNGPDYLASEGAFGIGSDSNIRISLTEELRMLEYSQRLRDLGRSILISGNSSVGETLYLGAAKGGAQALGRSAGRIEVGALADLVAIDTAHPTLCSLPQNRLLDGFCFASEDRVVTDVWSAGRHQVQSGAHIHRTAIQARFRKSMVELLEQAA